MNLVLIGYRGTGKSTIGRLVAEELGFRYVSTDEEIVRRAGMSIPDIVERRSWDAFRDLEEEAVEACIRAERQVIDTGGGVIERPRNRALLGGGVVVFLLEAQVKDIVERMGEGTERPSLTGTKSFKDEVEEVLARRMPIYRSVADYRIDTSTLSAEEAAREIVRIWRSRTP